LPEGLTPRLLSRQEAAIYCGMSPTHFDEQIRPAVPPLDFGKHNLWDIKALDRWFDQRSGLAHAGSPLSIEERLNNGDQGARR
jgi:hypothetical protein